MRPRDNPFRTERLGRLAFRAPGVDVEALCDEVLGRRPRCAIVGPHGTGKTTLLGDLGRAFAGRGLRVHRHFLSEDRARPSAAARLREAATLGPGDVLLFDGAGHLGPAAWAALRIASRRATALVVTAHGPGRGPTLLETRACPERLGELVGELLGRRDPGLDRLVQRLHEEHGGNAREALLALYDLAARDEPTLLADRAAPRFARDEPAQSALRRCISSMFGMSPSP